MLLSSNSNAKLSTHQISNLFHFDDLNGNKLWLQDASDSFICLGLIQLANIVKKKKKTTCENKSFERQNSIWCTVSYFGAMINFLMFELMANKMTNTNLSPFTMLKIKTQVGGWGSVLFIKPRSDRKSISVACNYQHADSGENAPALYLSRP